MRVAHTTYRELRLEIDYGFTPGRPATGPSYSSGGEPAEGPEVDINAVWICNDGGKRLIDINPLIKGQDEFEAILGALIYEELAEAGDDARADAMDE